MEVKMEKGKTSIGCLGWIGRALLVIAAILVVTGLAGATVRANLRAKFPPAGQMVDVGGYRMHIHCQGSGSPTVIIEAGQGGMGLLYQNIQKEIARDTRVCIYDRAGLGWSEMGRKPRSAQVVVDELHRLLQKTGVDGPYVLVGHSLGGLFTLLYTHTYPQEVAGIILLDSPHMDRLTRAPQKEIDTMRSIGRVMPVYYTVLTAFALTGIPVLLPAGAVDAQGLSSEVAEVNSAVQKASIRVIQGSAAELAALEAYYQQIQEANITSFGEIPVIAMTHTRPEGYMGFSPEEVEASEQMWLQFQYELAGLSSQGKVIIAENAGHNIHIEQPQMVIETIRDVLQITNVKVDR
jgi:pimeloyl-ACP methyl ester carboxylesterase